MQFAFKLPCFHRLLTCTHFVCITSDRIDFSIVHDKAVRMRSLPARSCVRTETGMYHCDSGLIILILQIPEELAELSYKEHSFVNDRTAGKRYYICIITALLKHTSDHIEAAVKVDSLFNLLRALDKRLHDARHTVNSGLSEYFRMYRHFSPAEEIQSFFLNNDFKDILRLIAFQLILRQKKHPDSVIPLAFQVNAQRLTDFLKELVGYLQKNTDTISGLSFCVLSCSVFQVLYDLKRSGNCAVALHTLNIYDRTDTAVVVFKPLAVKPLRDIILHSFTLNIPALCGYILLSLILKGFNCSSHDRCPLLCIL